MPSATRSVKAKVELDGEAEYKAALQELNTGNRTLATEMKKLQAEYKGNAESTEFLTKKGELLERQLLQQQDKVKKLQEAVAHAAKEYGESSETTQKYVQQLNNAEAAQFDLQHAIEENNKALEGQGEEMTGLGDTVQQLADKFGVKLPDGATKALNGMKGFSTGTVAAMAAAAAAIAAVVKVVTDLTKLTLEVAADVDNYITESAITGVPTEMLQAWDYAAPLIDTDAETIKGAMTKLTKAMGDAKDGSKDAQEKFAELGVSIQNQDGSLRSSEEVFYDVVDALGSMEAGADRDAAAMQLMGKSAQELNPLINAGSEALQDYAKEAKAAGYVLDESQIKKLAAVDDAYQRMQKQMEATKKQMAADFAPASEAAMELFTKVVKAASNALEKSGIIENLSLIIKSLLSIIETGGSILKAIPGFGSALDGLRAILQGVAIVMATIADFANVVAGLLTLDFNRVKQGLGADAKNGNYSNLQQLNGTAKNMEAVRNGYRGNGGEDMSMYGYDAASGRYYDLKTGNYIYGINATGNDNWRGGLTWVGEAGPELVSLPRGSQIYSNQDSLNAGGVSNYYINVNGVEELEQVLRWYEGRQVAARMRG